MRRFLNRRPSPAMAVAFVALLAALGGSSYAAVQLPNNSVGTKQLKNNAVTGKKIRSNAVTSGKVKDRSLLARDFKPGQLPAGPRGPQGPQGPKGDTGATGATGPAGATNVRVRTASGSVAAGATQLLPVNCNPGERATGGGGNNVATPGVNIIQSAPQPFNAGDTPTGWQVTYHNTTGATHSIFVYAVCAAP